MQMADIMSLPFSDHDHKGGTDGVNRPKAHDGSKSVVRPENVTAATRLYLLPPKMQPKMQTSSQAQTLFRPVSLA